MDETFVNNLAKTLRKVGTIHTVGEEWVSYIGEIPVGGVPYCGQMVTRATYSALWSYAQSKGLVKTEAEWQQIATANNGNVPFYSSGDGSSTFRMPKMVGYIKGASSQSVAGDYVAEGLPNITGELRTRAMTNGYNIISASGASNDAFEWIEKGGGTWSAAIDYTSSQNLNTDVVRFDASRSNAIYGNSSHVTPETSTVMFGVYAFGAIIETGALDATTLATGLAQVESNYLPLLGGTMTGNLNFDTVDAVIRKLDSTGRMIVRSSTGFETGGSLYLYGKDHEGGGAFRLYAHDGTTSKALQGKPDGTLTWDGKSVLTSGSSTWKKILSGTSKSSYSYTATKNCFVCAYNQGGTNNMTVTASIGGVTIYRDYGHHNDGNNSYPMMYVPKGQTITLTQDSASLHFSVLDLE